eukprot:SAG25_NODE_584_length_6756_cov_2.948776_2_plen_41_part_00
MTQLRVDNTFALYSSYIQSGHSTAVELSYHLSVNNVCSEE